MYTEEHSALFMISITIIVYVTETWECFKTKQGQRGFDIILQTMEDLVEKHCHKPRAARLYAAHAGAVRVEVSKEEILPMGLGTAMTWVQSKGRLLRDQMTGWTFCMMFREIATILHVSWRTATRLNINNKVCDASDWMHM